jgi:prepilin-type N-terminal cleavage/methylation domain-containing protein
MSRIKNDQSRHTGFTIVELLIVIVVIGILAAITIVAYTGISARAKNSKIQTNSAAVRKVAEAINADCGRYPATTAELTGTSPVCALSTTKLPTTLTPLRGPSGTMTSSAFTATPQLTVGANGTSIITAITGTTGEAAFLFSITGSAGNPTGGVIVTWDYATGTYEAGANYDYYGTATSASTFLQPAS